MPTIYQELQATAKLTSLTDPPPVEAEDQEQLSWLAQAIAATTKEQFEVMSVPAQEWFDAAADSLNTGNPIPVPAGYGEPEAPVVRKPIIGRPRASSLNGPTATPPQQPPAMTVSAAPEQPAEPPKPDPHPLSQPAPQAPTPAQQPVPPQAPPQPVAQAPDPYEDDPGQGSDIKPTKRGRRAQGGEGGVSVTQRIREYVIEREDITVDEIINKLKAERQPDMSGKRKPTVATLRSDTLRTLGLAKARGWQPPQHQPQH